MTLTSALNTAKSALAATQTQTALVSRNIANVNTEGATRKYANVVTGAGGRVEVRSIAQSSNSTLYRNMLDSTSALQQTTVVKDGLSRIDEMIGDIENGNTPAALIGTFVDKLKAYGASPQNGDFARSAANAARDVVTALNQGTETIDTIRRDADDGLVIAADEMTKILARIEDLNRQVVSGTVANRDVTDLVDDRDRAVAELSGYVGLTAQVRGNNDLVLYTDSGVTLFDKVARSVTFGPTHPLVDGQPGNGFRIDGTLVTGGNAVMPIRSGKVAGLVHLRDEVAVKYQTQLDEIARGLIVAFAETDQTASGAPAVQGMFVRLGTDTPPVLTSTDAVPGLARAIAIDPRVVDKPTLIRDGGINDNDANPATPSVYLQNTTGAAGFTKRINELVAATGATRSFDADAEGIASGSLLDFAASSVSWLQDNRSKALDDVDYKQTLLDRTKETLSNETGINLDQETLRLLDLERSFQASSKILSTVDEMMKTLLNAI